MIYVAERIRVEDDISKKLHSMRGPKVRSVSR